MRERLRNFFRISGQKSVYLYSVAVGMISGLMAGIFMLLLEKSSEYIHHITSDLFLSHRISADGFHVEWSWKILLIIFLPALGGLLTGLLVHFLCREASGMGTDSMIYAFHHKEGQMSTRIPFLKSIATVITLSTGGSGGKEGPISQIGAGFGSMVGRLAQAGARARRTLLLAGTAGGLGAVFHAPLGGALTAAEMVYKEDVESDALLPCVISSSTAYLINQTFFPKGTVFSLHSDISYSFKEIPFYFILGVLCFMGGKFFIQAFQIVQKWNETLKIPPYVKPALGGLAVGMLAVFFPEAAGTGEKFIQKLLHGEFQEIFRTGPLFSIFLFIIFFILKTFSASLTIGTGGSAGVFGPSLYAGCMIGGVMALVSSLVLGTQVSFAGYMLVGMGAFYSGVASAPIAGMIMTCEMVGSYYLLPPLMLVTIISFSLSNKFSIYKNQLLNRFASPAHFWDMNRDIMENIFLKDLSSYFRKYAILPKDTVIRDLESLATEIQASDFIIINPDNTYYGFVSLRKIKNLREESPFIGDLIILEELADTKVPCMDVSDTLKKTFDTVLEYDLDKVAVQENGQVLGYLRIADLFRIYYKFIKKK